MYTHFSEDIRFAEDPHIVIEQPDFSGLEDLYRGRELCFGDFHVHSDSGGKSDGKTTPVQWLQAMEALKLDFVGLMDHKQVRHMYLDSFDPNRFVCGTEPAGKWVDPDVKFHYLMIVPERECLVRVLEQFPDVFEFTGGTEGTFVYNKIEKARFLEVAQAVRAEGGVMIHAHPKQLMDRDDPTDYWFGEGSAIEIIYALQTRQVLNPDTVNNYKLWMQLLERDCRTIQTATSDCHTQPDNAALNALYVPQKNGKTYVEYLRKGELNTGFLGLQMAVEACPMGSVIKYRPHMQLQIRLGDIHPAHDQAGERYRLDVLTDRGMAYSGEFRLPFRVALQVQDRKFYRAVVIRCSDGTPAAIGNPIWLEKE